MVRGRGLGLGFGFGFAPDARWAVVGRSAPMGGFPWGRRYRLRRCPFDRRSLGPSGASGGVRRGRPVGAGAERMRARHGFRSPCGRSPWHQPSPRWPPSPCHRWPRWWPPMGRPRRRWPGRTGTRPARPCGHRPRPVPARPGSARGCPPRAATRRCTDRPPRSPRHPGTAHRRVAPIGQAPRSAPMGASRSGSGAASSHRTRRPPGRGPPRSPRPRIAPSPCTTSRLGHPRNHQGGRLRPGAERPPPDRVA